MKKVLFVVDEKRMGGVSVLLEDILKKINNKKYNIEVLVLHNNGDYLDKLPDNINIIYGNKFFKTVDLSLKEAIKSKNLFLIMNKLRLIFYMKTGLIKHKISNERKKFLNRKYDVEIAFKDGFCAVFTAYGDSIKKIHWLHTDYSMYDCTQNYKRLFDDIFIKFDKIIGISNSVVKKFKEKYNVDNTQTIYNIIDATKIKDQSSEYMVNYDKTKINFVSVGRFHNMKGYDRLVDVFSKLNKENKLKNVVLHLIGDGPDYNLIKKKIDDNKLQEKIILEGRKKNPFPYVKSADAFFMCSRYEPFGLVILEAMILGVPVISTEVASIHEIMNDNYGMIVENSTEGLYKAVLKIINNKKMLSNYKKNLRGFYYPIDKIVNQIESLLGD